MAVMADNFWWVFNFQVDMDLVMRESHEGDTPTYERDTLLNSFKRLSSHIFANFIVVHPPQGKRRYISIFALTLRFPTSD